LESEYRRMFSLQLQIVASRKVGEKAAPKAGLISERVYICHHNN